MTVVGQTAVCRHLDNHGPSRPVTSEDPLWATLVVYLRMGRDDMRSLLPFRGDYETWAMDQQRNYEIGRLRILEGLSG
jgi:hypothetical protein